MPEFEITDVAETPYLYATGSCSMDPTDISATMGRVFGQVWSFMTDHGIAPAGPALAVYHSYDPEKMTFRAGFVVTKDDLAKATGEVGGDVTPVGRALTFTHIGPYATLRDDYGLMMRHAEERGLTLGTPAWELYLNDPSQTPENELRTQAYVALA